MFDFSICHTTARPEGWQAAYTAWIQNIRGGYNVEYILCVDHRWGFDKEPEIPGMHPIYRPNNTIYSHKVVWNEGRKCSVDGWNTAAAASNGSVIILAADDVFPPRDWDERLNDSVSTYLAQTRYKPDADFVIQTTQGTESDARGLITCQMLSRQRYERLGYALNPVYEALFADDEFTEHARLENKIVDARHLLFEHRHPIAGKAKWDEQYSHQNNPVSAARDRQTLCDRRAKGFK